MPPCLPGHLPAVFNISKKVCTRVYLNHNQVTNTI